MDGQLIQSPIGGPDSIVIGGVPRALAARVRPQGHPLPLMTWSQAGMPVIPRDQWIEQDLSFLGVPIADQGQHGSCFIGSTLVRMADGTYKPIERINLLDEVVTAEGNVGRVTKLWVRQHDGELVHMKLWGHSHLKMTPEHPVLTKRGYVSAKDLQPDDMVAITKHDPDVVKFVMTAGHSQMTRWYTNRAKSMTMGVRGRKAPVLTKTPVPDIIELNRNTGRIFGMFLAEGSTDGDKVVWTFCDDEEDTLVAELVRLIKEEWGAEAHVRLKTSHHTATVSLYGKPWALLFESLCSSKAWLKNPSKELRSGSREFLEGLYTGWMDGDGHFEKKSRRTSGVSVSKQLGMAMFDIAIRLGLKPTIRECQPTMNEHAKTRRVFWEVGSAENLSPCYQSEQDDKHLWRRVREIATEPYSGLVFNLEVQGDNSYVAEGIGVHNCTGHGNTSALETAAALSGYRWPLLSKTYPYAFNNRGQDQGAITSEVTEWIAQNGTCPMELCPESVIYPRDLPDAAKAKQEALRYRIGERYAVESWDEVGSALSRGFVVVISLCVGNGWEKLDAEGMPPASRGYANHCIYVRELKRMGNGQWKALMPNSWGTRWGNNGTAYVTEAHFRNSVQGDHVAIKTALVDPQDDRQPSWK